MSVFPVPTSESEAPAWAAYIPAEALDPARCHGRRAGEKDRRWAPMVHTWSQCTSLPVSNTELCSTCLRHQELGGHWWNGFYDGAIPDDSHCAGSAWSREKAKWMGVARVKTARQEGRLDRAPLVKNVDLMHFLRGEIEMDLEYLVERRQITGQQLRDMFSALIGAEPGRKKSFGKFDTNAKLCAEIRRRMAPSPSPSSTSSSTASSNSTSSSAASPPSSSSSAFESAIAIITGLKERVTSLTATLRASEEAYRLQNVEVVELRTRLATIRTALGLAGTATATATAPNVVEVHVTDGPATD